MRLTCVRLLPGAILPVMFAIMAAVQPAIAEKRVALVIGNSGYQSAPVLANPRNDAEDIGKALTRLGFDTVVALDADRAQMEQAVEQFAAKTDTADVALFYYAGHGLQYQGANYLLPVDASLQSAASLRRLTRLNDIVSDVRRAKALRILMLDACRDNPLADVLEPQAGSRSAGATRSTGLAKLSRSTDTGGGQPAAAGAGGDIVVYAAEAGRTASDGTGRNSPFTSAMLQNIEAEGQEVVTLMRRVALSVQQQTGGDQRPELLLSVPFEFYFKAGAPQPPPTVVQLVPAAKPHEAAAIEQQIEAILDAAPPGDRQQMSREIMILLSDIASKSGLKPDQIATELPKAHARLNQMRREIAQFRNLMESEPGIAPFVEIAAAAVASGRRPDLEAADQALAQVQARYDDIIRQRADAVSRARANRASLSEQRGSIAETELRLKDAARFFLAAASDTPADEVEVAARRYAMAATALLAHGTATFDNDQLREAIRILETEAVARLDKLPPTPDAASDLAALRALIMAQLADAQTTLGGRLPGLDGAKMMVDARATYGKALRLFEIAKYPGLAMDILDRRSQRDIAFGRRITKDRGRGHFSEAVNTMRLILSIQKGKPQFADQMGRTTNNLANALKELARRTDGADGDRQIDEAITLFEQSAAELKARNDTQNLPIARLNIAHALTIRASRRPGPLDEHDIKRAQQIFTEILAGLESGKNPRLWTIGKRYEGELLRLIGERTTEPSAAFMALKSSFEAYQKVLPVISRTSAPNDWAEVCADMGYSLVAVLPHVGREDSKRSAENAEKLFAVARPYFVAGGFGQDIEKLDAAAEVASRYR